MSGFRSKFGDCRLEPAVAFYCHLHSENLTTQSEINRAVAMATWESVSLVEELGFGIAEPLTVEFDPEPRKPMAFDWDAMSTDQWPCCLPLI
jgi:hypothetical protein